MKSTITRVLNSEPVVAARRARSMNGSAKRGSVGHSSALREQAVELVNHFATHGIAQAGLMAGSELFFSEDHSGFIAYRVTGNIALALGDPVAPPAIVPSIACAFLEKARARHLAGVAFFEASRDVASALRDVGFTVMAMGAEPIVHLSAFNLAGGARKNLRQAYHRGKREGITVVEYRPDEARRMDWEAGIRYVERSWLTTHGGQSLQKFTDVPLNFDKGIAPGRLFLAFHRGHVVALSLLTPAPARHGWNMHVARRLPDAPRGTMEALDVETLGILENEGANSVSFGFCPLEQMPDEDNETLITRAIRMAARRAVEMYDAAGIAAYKQKFVPDTWEPRYLVFAPRHAFRRVAIAVIRAEVPGGLPVFAKKWAKSTFLRAT